MNKNIFKITSLISLGTMLSVSSCVQDEDDPIIDNGGIAEESVVTPDTYAFQRNGQSSVSYSGQTERLNQLAEMKAELLKGDNKGSVSAQALKDMFANTNDNGNGNFSFSSTKQLKSKTFDLDQTYFENLFDEAETASLSGVSGQTATDGTEGTLTRTGGKTILVDKNGREFTQLIEKGLMGATFYNQIVNSYLTDEKIGDAVSNTDLETGKNYTKMEHHMDEAFGYFGAPIDFGTNYTGADDRFWANYSNTADDNIQLNDRIMNAYKRARAAISEKKYTVRDTEVIKIYNEFEVLIAATAIHYANEAKSSSVDGDYLHVLSECYAFTRAFRYSNTDKRKLSQAEVNTLLGYIGDNFWQTKEADLNLLIDKLASTYGLESVKNQL